MLFQLNGAVVDVAMGWSSPLLSVAASPAASASTSTVSLGEAVRETIEVKARTGCRPCYVTSLRQYLGQFARGREETPLASIDSAVCAKWFADRGEPPGTQASNRGRLQAMFALAVRRGWIPADPVRRLDKLRHDRKPPAILTPAQAEQLLRWTATRKPRCVAFLALAMLAGVRPDEIGRLGWESVDIERKLVTIDAAASKVRRRRLVTLEPAAAEWLRFAKSRGCEISLPAITLRRWQRLAIKALGWPRWPQDVLRHTAASMMLAIHPDAGKVALSLGNSPGILLTHYRELVSAEDAAQFWAIRP